MAENPITLPELITINDRNLQDVEIPDFLDNAPFMRTNAAAVASYDTLHRHLVYENPPVGFRAPNDGREVQSSRDEMRQIDCQILDASFRTDLALAQSYRKGGAGAWMTREAGRHLRAAFYKDEVQVFNGRGTALDPNPAPKNYITGAGTGLGDDTGFNGLPNFHAFSNLGTDYKTVDAGGTANRTSVWLIRSGMFDIEIITGRSGDIAIGDTSVQETPGSTTGTYPGLYTPITAWYAVKVGATGQDFDTGAMRADGNTSAVRICNVDATGATGTALNDDLIYSAIKMFGSGSQPTHIYMNRWSLELLRSSRTATNPSGAPAPRPSTVEGVPVVPTDGILNGEAAVV